MASVFKRKGKGNYMIAWVDHAGRRREKSSRTTDKRTAERIAAKMEGDVALRREGVVDPNLDHYAKQGRRPIHEHLDEYGEDLSSKSSSSHATQTQCRIERVIDVGGIKLWQDLTPDAVERALTDITTSDTLSPQTRNNYLTAIKAFANWMVQRKRSAANPIVHVQKIKETEDEYRRALEPEEMDALVHAAHAGSVMTGRDRRGKVRWELTGPQRALLYRFACETGLRRSSLERLEVRDFDTGPNPAVTIRPKANTKERKLRVIPLKRETVDLLRDHFKGKLRTARAFNIPAKWETADMIREDLAVARAAWIADGQTPEDRAKRAEATFLADQDEEGRRIDFHALRTTCGTWLDHAGVAPSIAKRVTGHRNERMLQHHYQRANDAQTRRAVEVLPEISLPATGTDEHQQRAREPMQRGAARCDEHSARDHNTNDRKPLDLADIRDAKRRRDTRCKSEGDGTRTRNLRIDSPVL